MTKKEFVDILIKQLEHQPTQGQTELFCKITDFFSSADPSRIFIIQGYAGTGKTSLVKSLVRSLRFTSLKTVLLAPTGRAAKVLTSYTGQEAFTIHRRIYFTKVTDYGMTFSLQENKYKKTVFIVDEASMIGNETQENSSDLLGDLLRYVGNGEQCKLVLIGDNAQLPPVGLDESPALDSAFLSERCFVKADLARLTEVMRQESNSGILFNATKIRTQIKVGKDFFPELTCQGFSDVLSIMGDELEEALTNAYAKFGAEEVLVITRSNRNANLYNQQIRARIRWQENIISAGDLLMVVKNNYFWKNESTSGSFIANGDSIEIRRLGKFYQRGDFMFVDAIIRFVDYPDYKESEVRLLLNTLNIDQANLPYSITQKLISEIEADYADIPSKRRRKEKLRADPFVNAIQIKFGYAVTCHKAQGGQWKCVFIDQGYMKEEMVDKNYLRWLYTAITRAQAKVYFVNFTRKFFGES